MNTEFLNNLGITEKSTIDAIFAEYGKDLNALKNDKAQLETQVSTLNEELKTRDQQLTELKKSNKDNEQLTTKIQELEEANKTAKANFEKQILDIKKNHALERDLKEKYGAKNIKAVLPFLDMEKVTFNEKDNTFSGLEEIVNGLKESSDTGFLFNVQNPNPQETSDPNTNNNNHNGWTGFFPNNPNNQQFSSNNSDQNSVQSEFAKQVAAKFKAGQVTN